MQQYLTLLEVNPEIINGVSCDTPLTVEQIYQFVLQNPQGFHQYRTIRPYTSIDMAQIVESAATQKITVIQLPSDNVYLMVLQVQQGFGVRV